MPVKVLIVAVIAAVSLAAACTPAVTSWVPAPAAPPVSGFIGGDQPVKQMVYGCSATGGHVWVSMEKQAEDQGAVERLSASVYLGYYVESGAPPTTLGNLGDWADAVEGNVAYVDPGKCFTVEVVTFNELGDPPALARYTLSW